MTGSALAFVGVVLGYWAEVVYVKTSVDSDVFYMATGGIWLMVLALGVVSSATGLVVAKYCTSHRNPSR